MGISPNQSSTPDSSQPPYPELYPLSCEATLAVVFRVRDAYLRSSVGGGDWPCRLKLQYKQDRQWVNSEDTSDAFSCVRVCEALGLDPTSVREAFFSGRYIDLPKRSGCEKGDQNIEEA